MAGGGGGEGEGGLLYQFKCCLGLRFFFSTLLHGHNRAGLSLEVANSCSILWMNLSVIGVILLQNTSLLCDCMCDPQD